ncbi:uncharacterized protein C2845_PM01G48220 [Panicum miliaceum]|uniref:RCD1 WWE domain-containing protein n=1 Tax=Panicum miliaceum TaxID=4540 RepID=A0A3L6TR12_PANMI|nr:uncharacterized protein C2845_PM01G48220 [Panicum miliaceum]
MAFDLDLHGSGTPARVLCRDPASGRWEDVPATVLAFLQHAVAIGTLVARAALPGGRWHVFDFARMLRFDEADPAARPFALAWIDEGGNHFFPPGTTSGAEIEPSARCEVSEDEAVAVVRTWTFDGAVLTGARRCVPTSAMLKKFAKREQELGNIKLGCMSIAVADDKGEAHMLLCRIVQGQPAVLRAGSDWSGLGRSVGGVDYLSNPSWYITWNEHINSCIMPLCIVSFTKHPMIQDLGIA